MATALLRISELTLWTGTFEVIGKVVFKITHNTSGPTPKVVCTAVLADGTGPKDAIELSAWEQNATPLDGLLEIGTVVRLRRVKVRGTCGQVRSKLVCCSV